VKAIRRGLLGICLAGALLAGCDEGSDGNDGEAIGCRPFAVPNRAAGRSRPIRWARRDATGRSTTTARRRWESQAPASTATARRASSRGSGAARATVADYPRTGASYGPDATTAFSLFYYDDTGSEDTEPDFACMLVVED